MNYQGAQEARKDMKVPCEIVRVPQVLFYPCSLCLAPVGVGNSITETFFPGFKTPHLLVLK